MFDVITKAEFFAVRNDPDLDRRLHSVSRDRWGMKQIQDAWILTQLLPLTNARLLEVGGGDSRVLKLLDRSNEMVNLDKLEGKDGGPKDPKPTEGVRNIRANLGEFHPDLQADYFDRVFSISVMEHIPQEAYDAYWQDHARVLKPGGLGLHAIDIYIADEVDPRNEARLDVYRRLKQAGLKLVGEDVVPSPLVFRSHYASCSDYVMAEWNRLQPKLAHRRETYQCVSLKLVVTK